jgi:hypothetical protein
MRQPSNPDFERWEKRGLELARNLADVDLALHILCVLAFYQSLSGELAKVQLMLDSFHKRLEPFEASPITLLLQKTWTFSTSGCPPTLKNVKELSRMGWRLLNPQGFMFLIFLSLGTSLQVSSA